MASIDFLRECMQQALEMMDDPSKPATVRHAARARFWHCEKRVGALVRSGRIEDEPGHYLVGYSEEASVREASRRHEEREQQKTVDLAAAKKQREKRRYADLVMKVWDDWEHADKREMLDRKAEVQIKARERL